VRVGVGLLGFAQLVDPLATDLEVLLYSGANILATDPDSFK
jgi:hypothetical protein